MAADFFRTDPKTKAREIVPEAVFSAGLVLGLEPRGWKVEREAQSATGRTDIKARHDRFGEQWIVVEVKIWGRNDYADIHSQVTSYWTKDVVALATVMVADHQDQNWAAEYANKCLNGKVESHNHKEPSPALAGHFVARSNDCPVEETDHFLLQLPKRR
jgi:Holliday junction resolvase-like predicted endonuclease